MVAKLLSMIGGEYQQRVFIEARLFEIFNQAADVAIHFTHHPIVGSPCLQHILVIEFEVIFRLVIVADAPASLMVQVVV